MPFLDKLVMLKRPRIGDAVVLNPGWVVVRIRRVSAQRYRVLVRQPSKQGRYAVYFVNETIRTWAMVKHQVINGAKRAIEYTDRKTA